MSLASPHGHMDAMLRDLLVQILIGAEALDSIVVGGQALNIWGEHYFEKASSELRPFTPFQSKDIDFLGDVEAAKKLALMLEGDLNIPSSADPVTPSSALINVEVQGRHYCIDFLYSLAGLDTETIKKRAQILEVQLPTLPDGDRATMIRLLHPVDVLLSRIAAVRTLRRTDAGALRQLAAAPIILREFIRELLDKGDQGAVKEAQATIREFIHIAGLPRNDVIFSDFDIDLLSEPQKLSAHPTWQAEFVRHQIDKPCEKIHMRRARRVREARRKAGRGAY
ncbi:hypothetical protein [Yunchengibacter salinarum]|uniref:hypothetical protein n=1 Tax=Yunchengibacter salinarum TaxID=3133399 RepID=UPI0035B68FAC